MAWVFLQKRKKNANNPQKSEPRLVSVIVDTAKAHSAFAEKSFHFLFYRKGSEKKKKEERY